MPIQIAGITALQIQQKLYLEGSHFAEIHVGEGNVVETIISAQNVWAKVEQFDENGLSNGATPDSDNNHIVINDSGIYSVYCSLGCESVASGGGDKYEFEVQKNSGTVRLANIHAIREMRAGAGGDWASISMNGVANLSEDDTIELWIKNTQTSANILVSTCNLLVIQQLCKEM